MFISVYSNRGGRTKYINKHKILFHHIGEKLWYQPRKFPDQPYRG